MRRKLLIGIALVLMLTSSAWAGPDRIEVDVSDLVGARFGSRDIPVGWRVAPSNAMVPCRLIIGESHLLSGFDDPDDQIVATVAGAWADRPSEIEPLVDKDALVAAVAAAAGIDAKAIMIEDERLHVPAGDAAAVEAALAALRKAGPPGIRLEARLEALPAKGSPELLFSATGSMPAGLPRVFADAEETDVLTDFEVEIAQGCVIANPVTQIRRTGTSLLLRVRPLPTGGRALVEAVVRVAEPLPEKPIDLGHPGFGNLDRCRTGFEEAAVTFLAENGKPVRQLWTGRQGRQLRFTLKTAWTEAAEGDRALWSNMLGAPVAGFRNAGDIPLSRLGDYERKLTVAARQDVRRALADVGAGRPAGATPLRVEVFVVPAGTPVSRSKPAPKASTTLARADALVLEGLPCCFNGSREMQYLIDWDVEVAQSSRIPDPIIYSVEDGHFVEATVLRRGDARSVSVKVELLRLAGIERRVVPLDVAQSSGGVIGSIWGGAGKNRISGSTTTAPSMPQNTVALEQPRLRALRITGNIPLGSDGTGMLRRSARVLTGEAKDVVVVVRCPAQ